MIPLDEPALPAPPPIKRYPLGALVKFSGREAWISAISHTAEPLYQLTFIDDTQPSTIDYILHSQLVLIETYPVSDKRLSEGLRRFLNSKGPLAL